MSATCTKGRTGSPEPRTVLGLSLAAEAMELPEESLSARPALETEGLRFLHVTGEERLGVRQAPPCSVGRPPGGLALSPRAGREGGLGPSAASPKSARSGRALADLVRWGPSNTFLLQ